MEATSEAAAASIGHPGPGMGALVVTEAQIAQARKRMISGGFTISDGSGRAQKPSDADLYVLAEAGVKLGLDPLLQQVTMLGGKLYITLAGMYDVVGRSDRILSLKSRPATADERKDAMVGEKEHYWIAKLVLRDGREFEGHGFAESGNVAIANRNGWTDQRVIRNMAENRSLRRAMVKFFGIAIHDPGDREEMVMVPEADGSYGAPSKTGIPGMQVGEYPPTPGEAPQLAAPAVTIQMATQAAEPVAAGPRVTSISVAAPTEPPPEPEFPEPDHEEGDPGEPGEHSGRVRRV